MFRWPSLMILMHLCKSVEIMFGYIDISFYCKYNHVIICDVGLSEPKRGPKWGTDPQIWLPFLLPSASCALASVSCSIMAPLRRLSDKLKLLLSWKLMWEHHRCVFLTVSNKLFIKFRNPWVGACWRVWKKSGNQCLQPLCTYIHNHTYIHNYTYTHISIYIYMYINYYNIIIIYIYIFVCVCVFICCLYTCAV